jgi:hypothetical protein
VENIKITVQTFFQIINKLYKKSMSQISFVINFSIYKVDRFFIYKTLNIKKYIPILLGLVILFIIFHNWFDLYAILSTENSFKALSSLTLSLGSALVGVTAIVFMLIVFSLQVNIERLPYGLFYSLSSDRELMIKLGSTLILAILIASISLVQDASYAVYILLFLLGSILTIFLLLYSTYQRALKLINPYEQLMLIIEKTNSNLKWWDKRFERAKPLIKNSNLNDNFDWKRDSFFKINHTYFSEVVNALNFTDNIVQRNLEIGDYIVSGMALNTIISINKLYINAKKKTFFSYSPFLDTGLWDDDIINKTLEDLRLNFSINLKKNDERALNQILSCYAELARVYISIEYRIETNAKAHANLALQYIIDDTEKLVQLKNPDLLMNGIRNIRELVNFYIEHELLTDTVTTIQSIGRIGIITALDKTQFPVVQTAMTAFSKITQRLLVSKSSISFVLEEMNTQVNSLVKIILQQSEVRNHDYSLGDYYSYNNTSLTQYLTDLTNELLKQKLIGDNEKNILKNIVDYSDKSYQLNKELFLLALKNQSLSVNNFLAWITHFSHVLLLLSTLDNYKKEDLKRYAEWYLLIFTFIPEETKAIKYINIFSLTERLFESGKEYIEQDLASGVPTIINLLTNWSFKVGVYDNENIYQVVLGLLGVSYLTLISKGEYASEQLLKQIKDNKYKYTLSDETIDYISERLDEVIDGRMSGHGIHCNIEKAVMKYDAEDINNLLKKIKLIIREV